MHLAKTSFDRVLALMLLTAVAACDSSSQQAEVVEAAAEEPIESAVVIDDSAISRMGNEIFIAEDPDVFSPGVPIGDRFPDIRAMYQGEEVTNIDRFIKDNGASFLAVRSANW
jgi:hypothetical protein